MRMNRQGFTLLELLLGLSIFSLIALSVYSVFAGGTQLSERSQNQNEVTREARWAFDLMAQDLENMVLYDFSGSYPEQLAFTGSSEKVTFLSATGKGLKFISYYLVEPETDTVFQTLIGETYSKNVQIITSTSEGETLLFLVREENDFVDYLNGETEDTSIEILSTHVLDGGLQFSFGYVEDEESTTMTWSSDWSDTAIPSNVRISIDFPPLDEDDDVITQVKEVLVPSGYLGKLSS